MATPASFVFNNWLEETVKGTYEWTGNTGLIARLVEVFSFDGQTTAVGHANALKSAGDTVAALAVGSANYTECNATNYETKALTVSVTTTTSESDDVIKLDAADPEDWATLGASSGEDAIIGCLITDGAGTTGINVAYLDLTGGTGTGTVPNGGTFTVSFSASGVIQFNNANV
jgi:hypothetical protein